MSVPADQRISALLHPLDQPTFGVLTLRAALRDAGGILQPQQLQRPPKPMQEKAAEPMERRRSVNLVAMNGKQFNPTLLVNEKQPLMNGKIIEQDIRLIGIPIEVAIQFPGQNVRITVLNIMVAENVIKSPGSMELLQHIIDMFMRQADRLDIPEFQQLIAVPDLNVGKTSIKVALESIGINDLVARKFVRPCIVPAMEIAEENQPIIVVKGDSFGIFQNLIELFVIIHFYQASLKFFVVPAWQVSNQRPPWNTTSQLGYRTSVL